MLFLEMFFYFTFQCKYGLMTIENERSWYLVVCSVLFQSNNKFIDCFYMAESKIASEACL